MDTAESYGTILLPALVPTQEGGGSGYRLRTKTLASGLSQDYIRRLIVSLIYHGAVAVAVPPDAELVKQVSNLMHEDQNVVIFLDEKRHLLQKTQELLSPISDSIHIWLTGPNECLQKVEPSWLTVEASSFFRDFYCFVLAAECQAQLLISINDMKLTANWLFERTSGRAQLRIAEICGLLNSYEQINLPTLIAKPGKSEAQAAKFHKLLKDASYRQMSKRVVELGFPSAVGFAVQAIAKDVQRICDNPLLRSVVGYGLRVLFTMPKLPVPGDSLLDPFKLKDYLPPFVNMEAAVVKAGNKGNGVFATRGKSDNED